MNYEKGMDIWANRDKRWNPVLVNHINELNAETKARGAIGTLTNDPEHWAGYGVYTIGQLQDYLEKEFQHNVEKDERRNQ